MTRKKDDRNIFLELVKEHPDITDEHLKILLEKRLEMQTQTYNSLIVLIGAVLTTVATVRWFIVDISSPIGIVLTVISFIMLGIVIYPAKLIRQIKPLESQRHCIEQYLDARKRLMEKGLKK
jgi:hypothetical protein